MNKFGRFKILLGIHKKDIGMFTFRSVLTFVFIAHSASILTNTLPSGLESVSEIKDFSFALIELLCGIMILSGFLISIASYVMIITMIYFAFFDTSYLGLFLEDRNNTYLTLIVGSLIMIALVGPGKFVLNKRYGHTASSLREEGVDKESDILGT